jgi:hypothetical protein
LHLFFKVSRKLDATNRDRQLFPAALRISSRHIDMFLVGVRAISAVDFPQSACRQATNGNTMMKSQLEKEAPRRVTRPSKRNAVVERRQC